MCELNHPVEGEWNNFIFQMIENEDIDEVLENFREVFCKDEPINKVNRQAQTGNPSSAQGLIRYAESILRKNEGLSFVARDKVTGKIAGLRMAYIVRLDDNDEKKSHSGTTIFDQIHQNFDEITEEAKIFEKYGVSEYVNLHFTSVNPEYRGQGLVTEIYRRALDLLRSRKILVCKCVFTNPATHKAGIRYGFEELARRNFSDFNDGKGNKILPTASPEQVAILMTLKL